MPNRKYVGKIPPPPKKKKAPDINTSIIRNYHKAILSWSKGKVDPSYDALVSLNELLPPDYRVKINQVNLSSKNTFTKWFYDTLSDIQEELQKFRDDNWSKEE